MYDITDIDATLIKMLEEQDANAKAYGEMFFAELKFETRKLYRYIYPPARTNVYPHVPYDAPLSAFDKMDLDA